MSGARLASGASLCTDVTSLALVQPEQTFAYSLLRESMALRLTTLYQEPSTRPESPLQLPFPTPSTHTPCPTLPAAFPLLQADSCSAVSSASQGSADLGHSTNLVPPPGHMFVGGCRTPWPRHCRGCWGSCTPWQVSRGHWEMRCKCSIICQDSRRLVQLVHAPGTCRLLEYALLVLLQVCARDEVVEEAVVVRRVGSVQVGRETRVARPITAVSPSHHGRQVHWREAQLTSTPSTPASDSCSCNYPKPPEVP